MTSDLTISKTFDSGDLDQFVHATDGPFVSIYLPADGKGAESHQNPTRFRNLIRSAESQLKGRGVDESAISEILAPARRLLDRPSVWESLGEGLAVLLSPGLTWSCDVPRPRADLAVVGPRFHVIPLIEWLARDFAYFVLAVSQNRARLLRIRRNNLVEEAVPELPNDMRSSLNLDTPQGQFQTHTGQPASPGKEGVVFHGQGGAPDESKQEVANYLRLVERAVSRFLVGRKEPLAFVGVDYLFPIYREMNQYARLLPSGVASNPDHFSAEELRTHTWPLIERVVRQNAEAAVQGYWNMVSHGRTANRLEDMLPASEAGAVETLLIDPSTTRYGSFDADAGKTRTSDRPGVDDEDLINVAAVSVLRHRGDVVVAPDGHVPGGGPLAAVLRFPFVAAAN
jgi:hypothetical protein